MSEEGTEICIGCEEVIDENEGMYWSNVKDGMICADCEHSDMETASNVLFIPADGDKERVLVGSYRIVDYEWLEDFDRVQLTRTWHPTDPWRGYFETTIEGYEEIKDLTGWTTGWYDSTTSRKETLNNWLQSVYENDNDSGVDFAIVTEVTSNVFSTAVGVWVREGQVEAFTEWLNGQFDELSGALR